MRRFDTTALSVTPPRPVRAATAPEELRAWCLQDTTPFAARPTPHAIDALQALQLQLDGSLLLRSLPSARARWSLRIGLLLREQLGLRRADDPWDCGWARSSTALASWTPRRPTLIVSAEAGCEPVLAAHAASFRHPVRLLLCAPQGEP